MISSSANRYKAATIEADSVRHETSLGDRRRSEVKQFNSRCTDWVTVGAIRILDWTRTCHGQIRPHRIVFGDGANDWALTGRYLRPVRPSIPYIFYTPRYRLT